MLFRKYLDFSGLYSLKIMIFLELNKKYVSLQPENL